MPLAGGGRSATLHTDEHGANAGLEELYNHEVAKSGAEEFAIHTAHANGFESVWAEPKFGYNGVYHHWRTKHMRRYVNEFVYQLSRGESAEPHDDAASPPHCV